MYQREGGRAVTGTSPRMGAILGGRAVAPYSRGMDQVTLPADLERFAAEAVAAGRYRDVTELVAAGVSLLQRQEAVRAELLASVLAAEAEADRDGCATGDEMVARVRARLAEKYGAAV